MGARGSLRGRQHHSDQAAQGLHGLEELGDEAREAKRNEESQGGAGAQTRRHHASDAGRWHEFSVMSRRSEERLQMTTIIIARYAARRSSPAQERAASRLRGSDGAPRPSKRLAMPSMPLYQPRQ